MMRDLSGQGQSCGILFGPERTGLENDDVALAETAVQVPLNPEFSSLNLGQAVLILAYEWFQLGGAEVEAVTARAAVPSHCHFLAGGPLLFPGSPRTPELSCC